MTHVSKLLRASVALAALCVAACANPVNGPQASFDPNTAYPISVEPRMMTLRLPADAQSTDQDQNLSGQLERFAADYLDHGSGAIAVSAPNRYRNAPSDYAERLVTLGIPRDHILVGNQDDPSSSDAVKLTYIRYVAETAPCGNFTVNEADTAANLPQRNFGCATQHNIAAMVADPRDLVSPRALTPDDAQRRLEVLDKYRKGQTTVAEKTQAQSGTVATVTTGM